MNKTIIININSIVFHIEEDAYEALRTYMIDIKKHFGYTEDSIEILQDIENRIAEMFSERIQNGKKEVITMQDVEDVIAVMGKVSDFEEAADESFDTKDASSTKQSADEFFLFEKKLMRNTDDKVVSGVCSGLGYYFGIEARWVRLLFILFFIFGGSGVLFYIVLWIVMPKATSRADKMAMRGEVPNLQNFKSDWDNYKGDFTSAKNFVSKSTTTVGNGASTFFSVIGKVLGFIVLFVCGMTIFGMFLGWIGFASGIIGYQNEMVFPGTTIFPTAEALLALTAGTLAIVIPFIALFFVLLRIIFNTNPTHPYLRIGLWTTWILSILTVVFFVFKGIAEFKEESTIKVEKVLEPQNVYQFFEKDIRVIDASTNEKGDKNFKIQLNGEDLSSSLKKNIKIYFQAVDSLEQPFIRYNYSAAGKTYQEAANRASKINYLAKQQEGKVYFDNHFKLAPNEQYRDQEVEATVFLPLGAKVILDNSLRKMIREIDYFSCKEEYNSGDKSTEWIMTRSGLQCAPHLVLNSLKDTISDTTITNDVNSIIESLENEI